MCVLLLLTLLLAALATLTTLAATVTDLATVITFAVLADFTITERVRYIRRTNQQGGGRGDGSSSSR